jgi:hypothetical protein
MANGVPLGFHLASYRACVQQALSTLKYLIAMGSLELFYL